MQKIFLIKTSRMGEYSRYRYVQTEEEAKVRMRELADELVVQLSQDPTVKVYITPEGPQEVHVVLLPLPLSPLPEDILETKLESWQEEENPKSEKATRKFQIYLEVKEKAALYKKIKQELKLLLFNNRNLVNAASSKYK